MAGKQLTELSRYFVIIMITDIFTFLRNEKRDKQKLCFVIFLQSPLDPPWNKPKIIEKNNASVVKKE